MIQVWMFIFSLMLMSAHASEFTYIKLNPQFEQYLNRPQLKSISKSAKSIMPVDENIQDEYTHKIKTTLLGANSGAGDFTTPFPTEGEESLLYEQIRSQLEASHQEIGLREITQLDFLNRQFNLGSENFSGFSWQKPFGVVHIHADRQVTRNLEAPNYLVADTFTFDIEASTFLQRSNDAGITSMSEAEIGAFAGVTFKRTYTYWSYAPTYAEGLKSDFSKLFLPFLKFGPQAIARMGEGEIIKKEDNWTASAGGLIRTPPYHGFSFSAGVMAQFAYQNMVAIQNSNQKFNITAQGKKAASVDVNLSLQAEFLNILKLTILNYDLSYEYAKSKEFTLSLSSSDWQHANQDAAQSAELKSIMNGYGSVVSLEPYVVALENRDIESLAQRGAILVWGRLAKTKTEKITAIQNGVVQTFYKSYSQNMRVVQNLLSRLFSAAIYSIFKLPMGTKNAALYNRQVTLEYEATHPQAGNPDIARIDSSEQFSFKINQSYEASRTDRWIDKKFKNDVIWFVDSFTTLPKDYKTIIRSEQLVGPILAESSLLVEKAGFEYFLSQTESNIVGQVARVCGSKRISDWMDEAKRNIMLSRLQVGAEACAKTISGHYLDFKSDYRSSALKPSLAKFKSFLTKYYKQTQAITELTTLFGEENTFIHGQLTATTPQGTKFVTPFSTGQFRGLGVIDNYKRANGSRQPASIVSE